MCKVDAVVDVDVVELFYKFVFRQTGHKVNHILREREEQLKWFALCKIASS